MIVVALPRVQILDLAGPLQAFHEANRYGADYRIRICGLSERVPTDQVVCLADVEPLPEPSSGDLVLVPGVGFEALGPDAGPAVRWLRRAYEAGAQVASVCTGAFLLAEAGLLDGKPCTTHWSRVEDLQRLFPATLVQRNRLFVNDGRITTSAGIASGIDMALWLVEARHGPLVAASTAREMVVYLRRDGGHGQRSVYLEYRTHLHPGVHRVQDWLITHPAEHATLTELGRVAAMSSRNLTRAFRQATGISVQEFRSRVRLELARNLIHDPSLTVEAVARECGFESARQLRRLWRTTHASPMRPRRQSHLTR